MLTGGRQLAEEQQPRAAMIARNRAILAALREWFSVSAARLHDMRLEMRVHGGELAGLPQYNLLGLMPWKREIYLFGEEMTYRPDTFLAPYRQARFAMPECATGNLLRLVPAVNDFIAVIERVTIHHQGGAEVVPDVVQSRAKFTAAGDVFSQAAPFLEIKLSSSVTVREVEVEITFVDFQPLSSGLFDGLVSPAGAQRAIDVVMAGSAVARSCPMIQQYVG